MSAHSSLGICTLAPERPRADVGICRACFEEGLFDAALNAARHGLDEDPPRCHDCGHLFDDGCGCTCCYDYDDDESTGYPQDVHR